jgi:hypothetical protein
MKSRTWTGVLAVLTGAAALTWLYRRFRTIDPGSIDPMAVEARAVAQQRHDHTGQGA